MALDFFAGCLGGCAGIMVGYPLDTIKVHMQTQDYRNPKYKGSWHCFRTILAKESIVGLYRGMSSPMAGVAAVNAIIFGIYGQTQRQLTDPDRLSSHFLAGVSAGIAQTPVCSPIELAKTRLQLMDSRNPQRFSGPGQCLKHIYKHEGYRGVFKGCGITFLREAPGYGVYFLTYEYLTRSSSNVTISTPWMLLAGGLAGTASWVISYPLDVIKSRLQAESSNRYTGALDCLRQSVKAEGYSCLYRGLNPTILRAFPTNAATFAVVTWTFRIFREEATEVETIRVVRSNERVSSVREPSLGKWNTFLKSVSNDQAFSRSYYSTLATISPGVGLVLGNSVFRQGDKFMGVSMKKYEETQAEILGTKAPEEMKDEENDEDTSEKKEVVLNNVETGIIECSGNPSTVINVSEVTNARNLYIKADKNILNKT